MDAIEESVNQLASDIEGIRREAAELLDEANLVRDAVEESATPVGLAPELRATMSRFIDSKSHLVLRAGDRADSAHALYREIRAYQKQEEDELPPQLQSERWQPLLARCSNCVIELLDLVRDVSGLEVAGGPSSG